MPRVLFAYKEKYTSSKSTFYFYSAHAINAATFTAWLYVKGPPTAPPFEDMQLVVTLAVVALANARLDLGLRLQHARHPEHVHILVSHLVVVLYRVGNT
jgi:antibiotic biosynthesis monooxygenase (ABM) superfamily enzyme